jgi:anti-anti-sigma factor
MFATLCRNELEREDLGDVTVVRFKASRLDDEQHIRLLFQEVAGLVDAGRPNLVLNLGSAGFLVSTALGKLLMLHGKARAAHGRLALCHVSGAAGEALEVMHLKGIIPTYESEYEAVQSF